MPGKRGVTASANRGGYFWACHGRTGEHRLDLPPVTMGMGAGCITLLNGKSLEDWQVVHRSVAPLPWRGAVSLITTHY